MTKKKNQKKSLPKKAKPKYCGRCKRPKETTVELDGKDFVLNRETWEAIENPEEFICTCGRPTKWPGEKEAIAMVDDYLDICKDEEYKLIKSDGDKSTSYDNKLKVRLPMIEDFAKFMGVNEETINEWRKKYPKFSVACKKISTEQKIRLANRGLSGDYNPVITKLHLASNHGMKDKSDVTSNDEKISFGEFLDSLPK